MFENGNYRRRRRMKRPYRTGAHTHFTKMYDPYGNSANYAVPAARTMFSNNSYPPYPRYDAQ